MLQWRYFLQKIERSLSDLDPILLIIVIVLSILLSCIFSVVVGQPAAAQHVTGLIPAPNNSLCDPIVVSDPRKFFLHFQRIINSVTNYAPQYIRQSLTTIPVPLSEAFNRHNFNDDGDETLLNNFFQLANGDGRCQTAQVPVGWWCVPTRSRWPSIRSTVPVLLQSRVTPH